MPIPQTTPTQTEPPPGLWTSRLSTVLCVALGAGFLGLSLVPSDRWLGFFEHPLQATGTPQSNPIESGILWLRSLLPVCGLSWLVVAWLMRVRTRRARAEDQRQPERATPVHIAFLCLAVVAALLLRLPLMDDSLWYDEIASFWYYGQFGPGAIVGNMFTPANHVAQSLASWSAVRVNGGSLDPITLRLPALLFGIAALWPIWTLVRTSLGGRWPLLGIALVAAAPIAILESTEARGYAFMLFFSASACALLTTYLRDRRTELLPWYALCCTLGIWSHLVTVVVPIAHACLLVWLVCMNQRLNRQALGGLAAIALAALTTCTLLAPVLPGLWEGSTEYQAVQGDQPTLLGREGRWLFLGLGGSWAYLGGLAGLTLAICGVAGARGRPELIRGLLVCGLPILVAVCLVLLLGTWIYARFLVLGIPFTILAITGGFAACSRASRLLGTGLLALLLLGWALDLQARYEIPRQPIREVMRAIPENGSRIGVIGVVDFPIVVSWYVEDPTRIVDCGTSIEDDTLGSRAEGVDWLVIGYPERSIPGIAAREALRVGDDSLVRGFTVVTIDEGWIDEDGSMILLERTSRIDPDQS